MTSLLSTMLVLAAAAALASCKKDDPEPDADDAPPEGFDVPDLAPDDGFHDLEDLEAGDPDAPEDPAFDEAPFAPPVDADADDAADAPDDGPGGEVLPYGGCVGGDPRARFIEEAAPPDAVMTREEYRVSLPFANCSAETWDAAAFKLGSQAPQDNTVWGTGRVPLPGDVHPDEMAVIEFPIVVPDLIAASGYQWGIVHEGVEWLYDNLSPLHTIVVSAPISTVELCTDVPVELGGRTSATAQLQRCIDATPEGGLLEIPAGVYLMTGAVTISRSIILRTAGTAGFAAPSTGRGPRPAPSSTPTATSTWTTGSSRSWTARPA